MTDATPLNTRGDTHSSGRTWLVAWLIWLAVVAAGTVVVWQSVTGRVGTSFDRSTENEDAFLVGITRWDTDLILVDAPREQVRESFRTVRYAVAVGFATIAILFGVAFTLYRRMRLSKWTSAGSLRASLLGGGFIYGTLCFYLVNEVAQEWLQVHFFVKLAFVVTTYPVIVVLLVAIWDGTQGRLGLGATLVRGVLKAIAVLAGLSFLALLLFAVLGKVAMVAFK